MRGNSTRSKAYATALIVTLATAVPSLAAAADIALGADPAVQCASLAGASTAALQWDLP